jgi:hypothetical protein
MSMTLPAKVKGKHKGSDDDVRRSSCPELWVGISSFFLSDLHIRYKYDDPLRTHVEPAEAKSSVSVVWGSLFGGKSGKMILRAHYDGSVSGVK